MAQRSKSLPSKRRTGKTATIRRTAAREICVSRHHGAQLSASLKPFETRDTMLLTGLRRHFNWSPIMQREASLSDSRCDLFQSGSIVSRLEKIASAVWETSVYRHNGGLIKDSLKPISTIVLWRSGGFQGAFKWAPMMARDASFSDSYTSDRYDLFSSHV